MLSFRAAMSIVYILNNIFILIHGEMIHKTNLASHFVLTGRAARVTEVDITTLSGLIPHEDIYWPWQRNFRLPCLERVV